MSWSILLMDLLHPWSPERKPFLISCPLRDWLTVFIVSVELISVSKTICPGNLLNIAAAFSILSEGGDKLSQNSLNDLSHNMENSHGNSNDGSIDSIKALLDKLPSSQGNQGKVQKAEELKANAIHFDPNNYSTEETQRQIWEALSWRDGVMRDIESAIEGIPGLETLVDEITQAVTVCKLLEIYVSRSFLIVE